MSHIRIHPSWQDSLTPDLHSWSADMAEVDDGILARVTHRLAPGVELLSPSCGTERVDALGIIHICVGVIGRGEKGGGHVSLHSFGKAF